MPTTISTADARKNFAQIVNKVAYGNEPFVLTRRGQKVAALISIGELDLLQQIEAHIDIEDAALSPALLFWTKCSSMLHHM